MELRHLRYFTAVAEELNFTRAAERLNTSQPPLSRQIRDLESELKVKLFERNRQEVKLTRVGRALLGRARELMRDAELLRTQAREVQAETFEELQLGYAPSPTAAIIAGILNRYHELAPGASVTLHDLSLSEILTGLKAKKLHAGLTLRPRPGEMRGLKFEALRRYSVGIICAKTCPLAQFSVIRPSAVPMENLVGYRAAEFPEYHQANSVERHFRNYFGASDGFRELSKGHFADHNRSHRLMSGLGVMADMLSSFFRISMS